MFLDLFEEEDSVITSERLTLRLLRMEDAADILEIRGDQDTADDAGVPCMESIEDAIDYISRWGEDSVAIVLGDEVIGLIESYSDEELIYDSTFIGYYLKKKYRRMGYMTEALTTLKNKLLERGESDFMLWIFPDNRASIRVAEKCGWHSLGCHLVDIECRNQFVEFFTL